MAFLLLIGVSRIRVPTMAHPQRSAPDDTLRRSKDPGLT